MLEVVYVVSYVNNVIVFYHSNSSWPLQNIELCYLWVHAMQCIEEVLNYRLI